MRRELRCL